jgi:hypothetical protein
MYTGLYTVYEKYVIGIIAHNPYIFHDNNILNLGILIYAQFMRKYWA